MNEKLIQKAMEMFDNADNTAKKWDAFLELVKLKEDIQDRWWLKLIDAVYKHELNEGSPDWVAEKIEKEIKEKDKNKNTVHWVIKWFIKGESDGSLEVCFDKGTLKIAYDCNYLNEKKIEDLFKEDFDIIKSCFDRVDENETDTIDWWENYNFYFGSHFDGKIPVETLAWYAGNRTDEFVKQLIAKVRKFQTDEITALFKEINKKCCIKK